MDHAIMIYRYVYSVYSRDDDHVYGEMALKFTGS